MAVDFAGVFSGKRDHVDSGVPVKPVFADPKGGSAEPSDEAVTVMMSMLVASRFSVGHDGFNPFPWVRRFKPKTAEDAAALLGVAQQLGDPELSPTDMQNLAKDILRNPKVAKFFGF